MGIFDFIKGSKSAKHEIQDEERELGGETTAIKTSLKKARAELEIARIRLEAERDQIRLRAEIEEAKQDLADLMDNGEEEESSGGSMEDTLMAALLARVMGGQQQPAPAIAPPAPAPVDLEEAQFREIWDKIPKTQRTVAKKMTDDQIKAYINGSLPGISEESLNKAVAFVRRQ